MGRVYVMCGMCNFVVLGVCLFSGKNILAIMLSMYFLDKCGMSIYFGIICSLVCVVNELVYPLILGVQLSGV